MKKMVRPTGMSHDCRRRTANWRFGGDDVLEGLRDVGVGVKTGIGGGVFSSAKSRGLHREAMIATEEAMTGRLINSSLVADA